MSKRKNPNPLNAVSHSTSPNAKVHKDLIDELLECLDNISKLPFDSQKMLGLSIPSINNIDQNVMLFDIFVKILSLPTDELNKLLSSRNKQVKSITINDIQFDYVFCSILNGYQLAICRSVDASGKNKPLFYYKSGSQVAWRLALSGTIGLRAIYDKLTDYTITTLVDFRMQTFLETNYDLIYELHIPTLNNINYLVIFNPCIFNDNLIFSDYINLLKNHRNIITIINIILYNASRQNINLDSSRPGKNDEIISEITEKFKKNGILQLDIVNNLFQLASQNIMKRALIPGVPPKGLIYKPDLDNLGALIPLVYPHIETIRPEIIAILDLPRKYNSVGSELFYIFEQIHYYSLKEPCNIQIVENIIRYCKSKLNDQSSSKINLNVWQILDRWFIKLDEKIKQSMSSKQCLQELLLLISYILDYIFNIQNDPSNYTLSVKNKEHNIHRDSTFVGSPCRLVTTTISPSKAKRRSSINNSSRGNYSHTSIKVSLLDNPIIVKSLMLRFKQNIIKIEDNQAFIFYYGEYELCGEQHKIPLCLVPCDTHGKLDPINQYGLPSKYISMGVYIGKIYDYSNQVCSIYDRPVRHVKINPDTEYKFCGKFYDNVWPFNIQAHAAQASPQAHAAQASSQAHAAQASSQAHAAQASPQAMQTSHNASHLSNSMSGGKKYKNKNTKKKTQTKLFKRTLKK